MKYFVHTMKHCCYVTALYTTEAQRNPFSRKNGRLPCARKYGNAIAIFETKPLYENGNCRLVARVADEGHGHTHTHRTTTVTLAAHASRGLMKVLVFLCLLASVVYSYPRACGSEGHCSCLGVLECTEQKKRPRFSRQKRLWILICKSLELHLVACCPIAGAIMQILCKVTEL